MRAFLTIKTMNKNVLIAIGVILIALTGGFAIYYYNENQKNKRRAEEAEKNNLQWILDSLKQKPDFTDDVKNQLNKMADQYKSIDIKISNELRDIINLLEIGQYENAIEDLVKIIGHLLETHYKEHAGFKEWLKKKAPSLHNMLTFCREEKKINEVEYKFFIAIKEIRNKEDHELDVNLESYLNASGLITAIGGILKLSTIVYSKPNIPRLAQ